MYLRLCGCEWDEDTLEAAFKGGHLETLTSLIRFGCPSLDCESLCDIAIKYDQAPVLGWLRERYSARTVGNYLYDKWLTVVASGSLEVLKYLRDLEVKEDGLQEGDGWDPYTCFVAIEEGHIHVLQWAIDAGCPWTVESRDPDTLQTGLFAAIAAKRPECVEFIIGLKVGVNADTQGLYAPLYEAAKIGELEIVRVLVQAGANVNVIDESDEATPLDAAMAEGHQEVADFLRRASHF